METKNNKTIVGILVLFVISTLLLGGYIIYDKIITKPENNSVEQNNSNGIEKGNQNSQTQVSNDTISVLDAVNYTDDYYKLFKVKLPKIVGANSQVLSKLNDTILNEVLPRTYGHAVCHAEMEDDCMNKGSTVDYSYIVKNNVVAIYIYSSVPDGANAMPASGNGLFYYNYFYDITNDKSLSLGEAAERMNITDIDGANTYSDLNNVCSSMIIKGDTITIDYMEGGC